MNLTRSVLWTVIGFALCPTVLADSPNSTPTRLAIGQSGSDRVSFSELIRSQLADSQLISDQSNSEEKDPSGNTSSGEDVSDPDVSDPDVSDPDVSDPEADENEDRQRYESMMSRIAALKKPASEITILATADGTTPADRSRELSQDQSMILISAIGVASVGPNRYTTCVTHRPLYYEQSKLERCGQGYGCWQNGVSGTQFLWNTMFLPCKLRQQH